MDENPERRRYYPDEEKSPLSETIREAVEAHENTSLSVDELALYEHINPDALDMLFDESVDGDVGISVQLNLPNVTVRVWSDAGIDFRVTDRI
jgi:hypothetical protein